MPTIICVGKIVAGGDIAWKISPLPVEEVAPDGELQHIIDQGEEVQRLLDEAADTEDYEWDIDDRAIWRRPGW